MGAVHTEVGEAETMVVLDPVLHEAVESQVQQAHGPGDGKRVDMPSSAGDQQCQRQRRGVREVVNPGAHPRADKVGEPGQVGDEQQRWD